MNKSTRFIVTAAALAGLYAGSMATRAYADTTAGSGDQSNNNAGKHDCKGQNSCKGKGGCNTNAPADQPSPAPGKTASA